MIRPDFLSVLSHLVESKSMILDAIGAVVESEVESLHTQLRNAVRDGDTGTAQRLQGKMEGLEQILPAIQRVTKTFAPDRE